MSPPTPKRKRVTKVLYQERKEIDYWKQLDEAERAWLNTFLFEYYQADFNKEGYIHPTNLIKDCRDRNNSSKRQLHSVGQNILTEAAFKARLKQSPTQSRYYTPEDYPFYRDDTQSDEEE